MGVKESDLHPHLDYLLLRTTLSLSARLRLGQVGSAASGKLFKRWFACRCHSGMKNGSAVIAMSDFGTGLREGVGGGRDLEVTGGTAAL